MAGLSTDYKTVELAPLTGLLDTRSSPHEIPYGGYRWVENVTVSSQGKACRRPGFERLYAEETPYNNQDLHDQLDGDITVAGLPAIDDPGEPPAITAAQVSGGALDTGAGKLGYKYTLVTAEGETLASPAITPTLSAPNNAAIIDTFSSDPRVIKKRIYRLWFNSVPAAVNYRLYAEIPASQQSYVDKVSDATWHTTGGSAAAEPVANTTETTDQVVSQNLPRQPISMLFEAASTTGVHNLLAATQNRIYAFNQGTGNWVQLATGLGGDPVTSCSDRFFTAAQVQDIVVLTNNFDKPVYWTFDATAVVNSIPDLDTLNISRAGVVCSWKGLMILGDIIADGVRISNRLIWSDFRKPLSFVPNQTVSVAGSHDLGSGEDILGMLPMADSLLIYTTHGIWEVQVTGGEDVLSFRQRYAEPLTGNGCLAYRRTLISTGDTHLYFGRDGIYGYNFYQSQPQRIEWIHRAAALIFDELETSLCGLHVGGWNPMKKEAWFSWARTGDTGRCPYRTLVVNTQYQFADVIQRGFSAFTNYSPTTASSIRQFFLDNCICTEEELDDTTVDDFNAGGGFCVQPTPTVDCPIQASSIYSTNSTNYLGLDTEDFTGEPDGDSLCAILGAQTLAQLCAEDQQIQACSASQRFVMASTSDNCLKQYGTIYAHELCTNFAACAVYQQAGYDTVFRSGPIDFKAPNAEKFIRRVQVNVDAAFQTLPSSVVVRLGAARQPSDPNTALCPIIWRTLPPKQLACGSSKTETQLEATNNRPYLTMEWPTMVGGRFFYWEIKVSGTGGASCFSSIDFDLAARATKF